MRKSKMTKKAVFAAADAKLREVGGKIEAAIGNQIAEENGWSANQEFYRYFNEWKAERLAEGVKCIELVAPADRERVEVFFEEFKLVKTACRAVLPPKAMQSW